MKTPLIVTRRGIPLVALCIIAVFSFSILQKPEVNSPSTPRPLSPTTSSTNSVESAQRKSTEQASNSPLDTPRPTTSDSQVATEKKLRPIANQIPYYLLGSVNDPGFTANWANTSVQTGRAWDLVTGSNAVKVAVIDTGFELNHEDLAGKWATNAGEMGQTQLGQSCWTGSAVDKQDNNCDDDQNGYIDDWRGYDFFYDDNTPQAGQVNPTGEGTTHATMVSGVVGATANNNKGGAGIDQQARILPLQVFSDDGEAYTFSIVAAIDYATAQGVKVINLSLGTNQYDGDLLAAITDAQSAGVVVIAASGNCALNDQVFCNSLVAPGRMTYPALYPAVLAVGATASNGSRADYSSYGPKLDIVAPGSNIGPLPVYNNGAITSYASASGTSFSAPLVAGMAALLIAQRPTASVTDIQNALTESTLRPTEMGSQVLSDAYGFGVANAHRATLLNLARTQTSLLGTRELSPREPSNGAIWRSSSGTLGADESVLVGCRVSAADICSISAHKGATIARFTSVTNGKAPDLQYIFFTGSNLGVGAWDISVQNNAVGKSIGTLTR